MARPKAPKVGDRVMHHGRPHEITRLPRRAIMRDGAPAMVEGVVFENETYRATMVLDEALEWSEADSAWYFAGRLLARNEPALAEAITGSWPPAANHAAMRSMLDAVDLETVDREKLRSVLLRRKADVTDENASTYIDAALAQVAELRANRGGSQ